MLGFRVHYPACDSRKSLPEKGHSAIHSELGVQVGNEVTVLGFRFHGSTFSPKTLLKDRVLTVSLGVQVGNEATVLGFVGAPFTLASYIVEGGSSKSYTHIKRLAFGQPEVLHALLSVLADNIADYVRFQVRVRLHFKLE